MFGDKMISIDGAKLALMAAAVARVNSNTNHSWNGDRGVEEIGQALNADISVYDVGKRGEKVRHVRFDFTGGAIEVAVCPQPELVQSDNRPEGDDPGTPGTPIAMAA